MMRMSTNLSPQLPFTITSAQHDKLAAYVELLLQWNSAYNLIGRSTAEDVWQRHILDAAQLVPHVEGAESILDIGSGAGLPAVVLAILTDAHVTACEKRQKKCDFLRHVQQQLGLKACFEVQALSIEDIPAQNQYACITARALAPLPQLISWAQPRLKKDGVCVFPKGKEWATELSSTKANLNMTTVPIRSITNTEGRLLIITNLAD